MGSILGPLLYNIFVSDIPNPSPRDLLLSYADDVLVAFTGPRASTLTTRANIFLEELYMFFQKWGLKINSRKCSAVIIKGKPGTTYPNFRSYFPGIKNWFRSN